MHFSIQHAENGKIKRIKLEDVTDSSPVFIDHPDGVQYKLTRTTISVYREGTLVGQLPLPTQMSDYGRGWGEGPRISHEEMQTLLQARKHFTGQANADLFFAALRGENTIYNQWAELKLQDPKYQGELEFPTAPKVGGLMDNSHVVYKGPTFINSDGDTVAIVSRSLARQHPRSNSRNSTFSAFKPVD